jgi:hypothetical protein
MSDAEFRARLEEVGRELDQATVRWTAKRRRRRQSLALACAAFVVGGAAITASMEIGSNGVEPAAAQVLERAAQADSSGAKPRGGRYFYTETLISARTRTSTPAGQEQTVISTQRTELWAGKDGSGIQVAHIEKVEVPAPAVPQLGPSGPAPVATPAPATGPRHRTRRSRIKRYGKGTIGPSELGSFDTSFRDSLLDQFDLTARRLEQLSSSQSAFNDRVLAGTKSVVRRLKPSSADQKQAVNRQAFFLVAGMLGQWGEPMPGRLRRALYRFAGTLEGIEVEEGFRDERGQTGIALRSGSAQVVLAPKTYRLRATSYRIANTETTIETVRTAVVERLRERPTD